MNQLIKKSAFFGFLAAGIYFCYLISAVFHQKLLKKPYKHKITGQLSYCNQSLIFTIFPPLCAYIIGQLTLTLTNYRKVLPWRRCIMVSSIINFNMFTYNQAVIYASFPAVVMAKSCSLLSVIIVGVFCSRVKDSKLKLTHKKLFIGCVATLGIIFFNFFKKQEKNIVDQPLTLLSFGNLYLIMSLIGDGFLPDFQAELKSQFKPSAIQMYCQVNKLTFIIAYLLATFFFRTSIIFDFMVNYENFAWDVIQLSLLNAIGQLFIYRMIKQFRQHIPAFVIAFRKCLTVIINILWFQHMINLYQIIGIFFVFVAVFWQVVSNYREGLKNKEKEMKFEQISTVEALQGDNQHKNDDSNNLMQMIDEELKLESKKVEDGK